MEEAPFSVQNVKTEFAALAGSFNLPDGSTVTWGLSRKSFGAMSFKRGPEWEVSHNRMEFLKLFKQKIDNVVSPHLDHTSDILKVDRTDARRGARELTSAPGIADGLVTNDLDIVLLTTHADCMPVWLCAPDSGWIGLAHVGWRGLLDGIIQNLVSTINVADKDKIYMAVGPGISVENFEVGQEVADKFIEHDIYKQIVQQNGDRSFLDLALGAKLAGESAGAIVEMGSWTCTYSNMYLSSYRRDKETYKPMAAIIFRTKS